jgi:hypothetical protein
MNEYLQELLNVSILALTGAMSILCVLGAIFATVSFWRMRK